MKKPDHSATLELLLEAWFLKLEEGEQPDVTAHCAEHPELMPEFERLLGRAADFDGMFAPRPRSLEGADEPPPLMLGEFELIAPIGKGGSGEVYLARQTSLGRLVAIKRLRLAADGRNSMRLRREAEVAASLDHPGIVPIYAVGEQGGDGWIAMKWLTGPALDAVTEPLSAQDVARIGAATARALHEAHMAGIVHRDIKPSNVVLDGGNPCIVDFGLARDGEEVVRTTVDGHVSGTLLYMSPEQIRSGGTAVMLDGRTDVYSLGATLYELLCGKPPHDGDHPGQVIHRILEEDPLPPTTERDLATIVLRALDKDREQRFRSALEMAADLERYLRGEPILSRPVGVTTRLWKLARRNRRASLLVGSALMVAVGLGAVLFWNARQRALLRVVAVERVDVAIEESNLEAAGTMLASLVEGTRDEATERLQRRLTSCTQLERLLDAVQGRAEDVDPDVTAQLLALDASQLPAKRQYEFLLARPLALALIDRQDEARELLLAQPSSRGRDALLAAVTTPTADWSLPAASRAMDHLFAALAMRLAKRPVVERRAELDAALFPSMAQNWRIHLQDAILMISEGRHEDAYRALIKILPGKGNQYQRIVRRLMLREAAQLKRTEDVQMHIQRMRLDFGDTWTAADAAIVLDSWYQLPTVDAAEVDQVMASARARWPRDWHLAQLDARWKTRQGQPAEAYQLLLASVDFARTPFQAAESALDAMSFRCNAILAFINPGRVVPGQEDQAALRAIAEQATALIPKMVNDRQRASGAVLASRALLVLGDVANSLEVLEQLPEGEPLRAIEQANQAVAYGYAKQSTNKGLRQMAKDTEHALGSGVRKRMSDVLPSLRRAIAILDGGDASFLGQPAMAEACLQDSFISLSTGDPDAARKAVDMAEQSLGGTVPPGMQQRIHALRARLK